MDAIGTKASTNSMIDEPIQAARREALEDILQRLEDVYLTQVFPQRACINCWELEPCSCPVPHYWPLSQVIGRLSSWI